MHIYRSVFALVSSGTPHRLHMQMHIYTLQLFSWCTCTCTCTIETDAHDSCTFTAVCLHWWALAHHLITPHSPTQCWSMLAQCVCTKWMYQVYVQSVQPGRKVNKCNTQSAVQQCKVQGENGNSASASGFPKALRLHVCWEASVSLYVCVYGFVCVYVCRNSSFVYIRLHVCWEASETITLRIICVYCIYIVYNCIYCIYCVYIVYNCI